MLRALRAGLGFRVAIMIAGFAALCFVAPPAVMAFGHGSNIVHCLTHGDAVDHGMHHGGAGHEDHGNGAKIPANHGTNCCGLFFLSALPLASGPLIEGRLIRQALAAPVEIALFGRVPGRPDRPPISLLSV
jgi:hypothetical protein